MFRERDRQLSLLETTSMFGPEKLARVQRSWAARFREDVLPLIHERDFAGMYHEDNGRPNKPVQIVLGTLILKEMFDLTDEGALTQLEFNALWHHALCLDPDDAHCCQKTLHNFRAGLMERDLGRVAFERITCRAIEKLGISVQRQRLDSTHVLSNIALLRRLGLFCETIRVFLRYLARRHDELLKTLPPSVVGRYRKEDGRPSAYDDARSSDGRRRLAVCARDVWRLLDRLKGTAAATHKSYRALERLFNEQCEAASPEASAARDDDDDAGEDAAPVKPVEPSKIASNSLQTPHDPDVTYSGHKGVGYSAQVCETASEENPVEMITHVEVSDACSSDAKVTIPTIEALETRDLQPTELVADTAHGSAENALEAERRGTELVAPTGGKARVAPDRDRRSGEAEEQLADLTDADFDLDVRGERTSRCPAGHECVDEFDDAAGPNTVYLVMDGNACEICPLKARCPARRDGETGDYYAKIDLRKANLEERRRAEADGSFAKRYRIRSGIERTNSELKRRHGFGRLRVRGRPRVELALLLKATACNMKRMIQQLLGPVCNRRPAIA